MPVVIEELDVLTNPEPVPTAEPAESSADPQPDIQALLAREAWRLERLAAD